MSRLSVRAGSDDAETAIERHILSFHVASAEMDRLEDRLVALRVECRDAVVGLHQKGLSYREIARRVTGELTWQRIRQIALYVKRRRTRRRTATKAVAA
jgi:DNA-directed RNA polymerase specialized sigma24 family protein